MKKQWIALLTGCVLVCSMLAGCGHSVSAEK